VNRLAAVALLALALAAPTIAAPPRAGLLIPGKSLGGLRLGMTQAQVRAAWGTRYGVCRACLERTWYFTYEPGRPEGAGVSFRKGRVVAIFTHWAPRGWRTDSGIRIGNPIELVTSRYGALPRTPCANYSVLTLVRRGTVTAFYVVEEEVWGFGLTTARPGACR
jgi:hypothetical protein